MTLASYKHERAIGDRDESVTQPKLGNKNSFNAFLDTTWMFSLSKNTGFIIRILNSNIPISERINLLRLQLGKTLKEVLLGVSAFSSRRKQQTICCL